MAPSTTIVLDDTALALNQTAKVTITFTQYVGSLSPTAITTPNGTLSNLQSADEGLTWTALLTPNANTTAANNVITLDNSVTNGTGSTVSEAYSVDTVAPSAVLSISDAALTKGETAIITIKFSEAVLGMDNSKFQASSGTLSEFSTTNDGLTWSALLTPPAETSLPTVSYGFNGQGVTDMAGNIMASGSNIGYYSVNTVTPAATVTATIDISDTTLGIDQTALVTIVFSERVVGFDLNDLTADSGELSGLTTSDEGLTWTATLTPATSTQVTGNAITLNQAGVVSEGGIGGTGTVDSQPYTVDTVAPTLIVTMSDSALTMGETATVTLTFSEAVTGVGNGIVTAPGGTLSSFAGSNGGVTWTSTFTPNAVTNSTMNQLTINSNGVTDIGGNTIMSLTNAGYYSVDTVTPLAGPTATVSIDDTTLKIGDDATVTITFSELVTGFGLDDLEAGNGTLSDLTSSDEGRTWTAKLTPDAGEESFGNKVVLSLSGVTGVMSTQAGVGTTGSNTYWIDTKAPTATVTLSDSALTIGETAEIEIVFSEYVLQLDAIDLVAPNGKLGALSTNDEGLTWHATFTPNANVSDSSNAILLNLAGLTDQVGNIGSGIASSLNYTVNTVVPVTPTPTPPTPTPTPVLVDGVAVKKVMSTAPDGTRTQVVTIPTVTASRVDKDGTAVLADIPLLTARDGGVLLEVGLPVGFGVQASGASAARGATQTLGDLLAAISAHTDAGSAVQQSLLAGGTGFIGSLDAAAPLLVQTIVVSATAGASGTLVIRGAVAADGVAATALVIDGSALPDGTTIELQNVAFAVVTGNVRLVGGDGAQTILGDGGSQHIVLGADDDVLHGGAGNDIVGSGAGNDRIFGDEGDDIVFGGAGDDFIDGGTGRDIVQLVGSSRDDYSLRVADGKLVMTHRDGGVDGVDTVSNVEVLRFTGGAADVDVEFTDTDVASLVRLYQTAFDRNADEAGLNFWIARSEDGLSLQTIASAMLGSDEAQQQYQALGNEAFIASLYSDALDRAGSAQEAKLWVDALDSGAIDRGTALLGFADSAEMIALVGVIDTSIETI